VCFFQQKKGIYFSFVQPNDSTRCEPATCLRRESAEMPVFFPFWKPGFSPSLRTGHQRESSAGQEHSRALQHSCRVWLSFFLASVESERAFVPPCISFLFLFVCDCVCIHCHQAFQRVSAALGNVCSCMGVYAYNAAFFSVRRMSSTLRYSIAQSDTSTC
jgi:hypothetical protein